MLIKRLVYWIDRRVNLVVILLLFWAADSSKTSGAW